MFRPIAAMFLLAACGLPQLDTPASQDVARADYPRLAPSATLLDQVPEPGAELLGVPEALATERAALDRRTANPATALSAAESARLTERAAALRLRAGSIRRPETGADADLLERAARLRARAAEY